MLSVFLLTFILMLFVIAIMAIGYILQRKKILGSCGGISNLGLEKICDCEEPCEKKKKLMRYQKNKSAKKNSSQSIDINLID